MMMSLTELIQKHSMKVTGVLHVGAHLGEEAEQYEENGIKGVSWVEANPHVIGKIKAKVEPYGHKIYQALIYKQDGAQIEFHITNYDGMSSSVLAFGTHPTFSPDTVFVDHITLRTTTIDTLVRENGITGVNMLVMDLQGAEGLALEGAADLLPSIDYVFSEVNTAEVYVGCIQLPELDAMLAEFERVETYMVGTQQWGDSLWIRRMSPVSSLISSARRPV